MTRSPNIKDQNVQSSPVKPVPTQPAIPKLKFSIKLTHNQHPSQPLQQHPREHEAARLDENTKPGLPKITLSVRKANDERVTVVEPQSLLPSSTVPTSDVKAAPEEPPKRKRGRPPKNPQNTHILAKRVPTRALPSLGRPPITHKVLSPTIASTTALSLDTLRHTPKGPLTAHTTIGDAELAKIGRLKGHLATFVESDIEAINHADYKRPFSSKQDMIERLLPFHLLSMADIQVYIPPNPTGLNMESIDEEMAKVRTTFQTLIHNQNQQTIPTELRLLEQRLCLEEEKFLLEKMRNEYKRRLNGQ